MTSLAGFRIAWRAVRVNKLRSVLTMLGIVIGVGALIVMLTIGGTAQSLVEEQIRRLGVDLIFVRPGSVTFGGARLGAGSRVTLTEADAMALQRDLPFVDTVAPGLWASGQVVFGGSNWSTVFYGVTPEYFEVRNWALTSGRALDTLDVSSAATVLLLGETVARNLFGDDDPVGQTVRVLRLPMQVIGVLERKGQGLQGQDQDDVIIMPLATLRKRIIGGRAAKSDQVYAISVKVHDGVDRERAQAEIRAVLRERHRLHADRDDDFTLRDLSEILQARMEATSAMTLLLSAVAAVSLLVGGIGIMNVMLVSVTERTREIGLRMAVGARRRDILVQFLVEGLTLAVLGALAGIVLGVVGAHAIDYFLDWRMALDVESIVLPVAFATIVGAFSGLYPALKASRLLPIEALRCE